MAEWGNCTADSFKAPEDEQEAYIRRLEARLQRVRGIAPRSIGEDRCAEDIVAGLAQLNRRSADEATQGAAPLPPAVAPHASEPSIGALEVEPLLHDDSTPTRLRGSESNSHSGAAPRSFCAALCSCITRFFHSDAALNGGPPNTAGTI
jgi:hypothetical protein